MAVLVTGGTGYIGSHTVVELLNNDEDVIILDNLSNSCVAVLERIELITRNTKLDFYQGDILNKALLQKIFTDHQIDSVIHFAGLKAVGESVEKPLKYYETNVTGTMILCEVMQQFGVKNIVFSSSATVYGAPDHLPITEHFPMKPESPYGRSKFMVENILSDLYQADKSSKSRSIKFDCRFTSII